MKDFDKIEQRDIESIRELFISASDYHKKNSKGSGGCSKCICGQGSGGSRACAGLSIIRNVFKYHDFKSEDWLKRFLFIKKVLELK